jgi:hypothetical protein
MYAVEAVLGPAPPGERVRAPVDQIDQQRAGVVDLRPAVLDVAALLLTIDRTAIDVLIDARLDVDEQIRGTGSRLPVRVSSRRSRKDSRAKQGVLRDASNWSACACCAPRHGRC